jgi:predicted ATPase/class 3 adenylate cyclase
MASGRALPTGTVTFLFTDIEGSTNLARTLGGRWTAILEQHNDILRRAIRDGGGIDLRTEGDAFFAVFASAVDAVRAAGDAQRELARHPWPADGPVRVRMGMHTGEGRLGGDEYVGLDVHLAARIAAAAHGGQVLLSEATRALLTEAVPDGATLRDLGEHRLKDFDQPQRIHQLTIEGLPADFPPLRTRDVPSTLPVQMTTFVGREEELAKIEQLLSENRLLTLVGPGGTGKTRLALEAARRTAERYPDGVFFVDLSPVRDPGLVASSVVQALDLKEQIGRSAVDTLTAHLVDRRAHLLLDNFEQVVDAAPLVANLLRAAPAIAALVTSRIRLDLAGEQAFPVPPLELPPESSDLEALTSNEAVALFRERARAVQPAFEITADNARSVAQVCARLDGLPLAIELAAAQLRMLSPAELLERLEHRLPLRTGARDVPERQRTLRGTIEWSYRLLDEPERKLLGRLSVFAGGATPDAVDAVCNPGGDLGIDTIEGLSSLFDKSLIRRRELPQGSRFTMLETIREYGAERLGDEFDRADTERRHAEFFAALAERWGPSIRGEDPIRSSAELGREYENVRGAIDWSLREDRAEIGFRIGTAMWPFWVERGPLDEGRRAMEGLLALPSGSTRDGIRAAALDALGALVYWQADYEEARRAYLEAMEIFRELGDSRAYAETRKDLAYTYGAQGDPETAVLLIQEVQDIARAIGHRTLAAEAASLRGLALSRQGQQELALAALEEALEGFEAEGNVYWAQQTRSRIGSVFMEMGRLDEAEVWLRRAFAEAKDLPGLLAQGVGAWILSSLAFERGQFERALRLMGFSEALAQRTGNTPPEVYLGDHAAHLDAARRALGQEAVDRLRAEGKSMSTDQAIAYALGKD